MSLLLTLLACLGTSPDPGEDSASTEPSAPQALLGTGEWEWEALSDGDEIYVIQGPQGGWHLLGSVRTVGLVPGDPTSLGDPENPTTTFQVWVDGAPLVPNAMYVQGLDSILGGVPPYTHEMIGRFAILDITGDGWDSSQVSRGRRRGPLDPDGGTAPAEQLRAGRRPLAQGGCASLPVFGPVFGEHSRKCLGSV